jgi:hypothetical protein
MKSRPQSKLKARFAIRIELGVRLVPVEAGPWHMALVAELVLERDHSQMCFDSLDIDFVPSTCSCPLPGNKLQ